MKRKNQKKDKETTSLANRFKRNKKAAERVRIIRGKKVQPKLLVTPSKPRGKSAQRGRCRGKNVQRLRGQGKSGKRGRGRGRGKVNRGRGIGK